MNLVNISHKIMIVSAIVSTLITTLAFFFFVINEGYKMTFNKMKEIVWNLFGAFVYLSVGGGAVFHTILGY